MSRIFRQGRSVPDVSPEVEAYLASHPSGRPLGASTRAYFEPRFGTGLSAVRLHTDAAAAGSAAALEARAYTVGPNVFFGASEYAPDTSNGRKLLAHELAHVVQQGGLTAGTRVQRQAVLPDAPPGLASRCNLIPDAASEPGGSSFLFGLNSAVLVLSTQEQLNLASFVTGWHSRGSVDEINVQGFASIDGPQSRNWELSCARAEALRTELINRGVSAGKIRLTAHGASDKAATPEGNRRAVLSTVAGPAPAPTPLTPAPSMALTCPQSVSITVSRGNDDFTECQYETARITVTLTLDPCWCGMFSSGGVHTVVNYVAVLQGKSFADDPPTTPERTGSSLGKNFVLLEEGTSNESPRMVHTERGRTGDPDDTLTSNLTLRGSPACSGASARGRVFVQPRGGRALQIIDWSATASSAGVQNADLAIKEEPARLPTALPLRPGSSPYPPFPGTPRDNRCTCNPIIGEHEGAACPGQFLLGGATVGP